MQSFSYAVKDEILDSINTRQKADACFMGLVFACKQADADRISFVTENNRTAEFFARSCKDITKREVQFNTLKKSNSTVYSLVLTGNLSGAVFDYFKIPADYKQNGYKYTPPIKKKMLPFFIGGMFLSCGSLTDPNKDYHMEFVFNSIEMCNFFGLLLIENFDITPKQTERKKSQVVYIKESENIEDMLTLMGAQKSAIEIMNIKIYKDIRNKINRAVNCDNANIEKSLRAAERQIADIELIEKTAGLDSLPDDLREIAELRLENPDFNLKELGQALSVPISRSGANHRLERISKIAEEIKNKHGS